jgi:hypothetical protein
VGPPVAPVPVKDEPVALFEVLRVWADAEDPDDKAAFVPALVVETNVATNRLGGICRGTDNDEDAFLWLLFPTSSGGGGGGSDGGAVTCLITLGIDDGSTNCCKMERHASIALVLTVKGSVSCFNK